MFEKMMVYVVTVFFTPDCGFESSSEEYFARSYDEIEQVKERIRSDYSEDEIDEIIVSDEPEEREIWAS